MQGLALHHADEAALATMNIINITVQTLEAIANGAMATYPNVGAWMVNAQKRQAMCLLALNASDWEDSLRASFLSEVMADTHQWDLATALSIVNSYAHSWDWDNTKKAWWQELRESEAFYQDVVVESDDFDYDDSDTEWAVENWDEVEKEAERKVAYSPI